MSQVNVTELRNHLPNYLKRVAKGETIEITTHGKVVARIVPEQNKQLAAEQRLKKIRGTAIIGDVETPVDEAWSADDDHL